jgi:acyl carrier protein
MGLDIVEMMMAIEQGFGVEIPDDAAARMRTPRDVVTWLEGILPVGSGGVCLSQRAFYRLRERCGHHLRLPSRALRPATRLDDVLDADARRGAWQAIGADLGAEKWPAPASSTWLGRHPDDARRPATAGEAARYLATGYPRTLLSEGEGWSRREIERAVIAIVERDSGVDMREHTLESSFVDDLGMD